MLTVSLVLVGSAYANFGPHGGFEQDTDGCAGCHRAHTSFSDVKFDLDGDGPNPAKYALLIGGGDGTTTQFCYVCHGDTAPGASTNVESGIFDGDASTAEKAVADKDAGQLYVTDSAMGMPLNGGGFTKTTYNWNWASDDRWGDPTTASIAASVTTSKHSVDKESVLWGAGNGSDSPLYLKCTSCHDPHGTPNFRLLKQGVNGSSYVGLVSSVEENFPASGFATGTPGAIQKADYVPDYTAGGVIKGTGDNDNSLSGWCSGCHSDYDNSDQGSFVAKDYGSYEATGARGSVDRHRHPVNMKPDAGDSILATAAMPVIDPQIPLETVDGTAGRTTSYVGCLTCHIAHGSAQQMTGWAMSHTVEDGGWYSVSPDGTMGVAPDKSDEPSTTAAGQAAGGTSTLLRADNRGVCERCHNK